MGAWRGCLLVIFVLFAWSKTWANNVSSQDTNFKVYSAEAFFSEFSSQFFPEMDELQPDRIPEFRGIVDFLQATGIPILIGTNSNVQTIFELYLPVISRAETLNSPVVGITRENAVGNLYFIMHDAAHHLVGIPGLRRDDLLDLKSARERLIRVLLLKEQVATSFSLLDYIRIYWNWRDRYKYGIERKEFVQLNQGIFSFGKISRPEYVDLIGDFVFGRSKSYIQRIYRHMDPQQTRQARFAGVPLPMFNLANIVGATLESRILQGVYPPLAAIASYFGEVGYKGFMRYSEAMADFMLQEWYINWSDDFQYGYPLKDLEKRAEFYLQEMREGHPLEDREVQGEFHISHLRHEIALFARRVAEIKELGIRNLSASDISSEDFRVLDSIYQDSLQLYRSLESTSSIDLEAFHEVEHAFLTLVQFAAERFPVDKYIPEHIRQPFIQYKDYWRDITALALPRYGHNSNGVSPGGVRSWLLRKRQAQRKLTSRVAVGLERYFLSNLRGIDTYVDALNSLSADYEASQVQTEIFGFQSSRDVDSPIYLERMKELASAISFQIERVIKPQIIEQSRWQPEDRRKIFEVLDKLDQAISERIENLRKLYRTSFLERTTSTKIFHQSEARLNQQIDEAYFLLFELARMAQGMYSPAKYKKTLETMLRLSISIEKGEYWETMRSWRRFLGQVAPVNSQRLHVALQVAKRYLPFVSSPKSIVDDIADLPHRYFDFNKDRHDVQVAGFTPHAEEFESDAVAVFAINHETGVFDAQVAQGQLKRLGFERIVILASRNGFPELKRKNFKDENIIISESEKPLDQIVKIVEGSPGKRVAVIICPEGNLPSPAVHMPLAAKPGAFVLARKISNKFPRRNTYMLTAKLNGLLHLTSEDSPLLRLEFSGTQLVPKGPLSTRDAWAENSRLEFENWINEERGLYLADFLQPEYKTGSSLFRTSMPQAYLSFGEWFGSDALRRCIKALSYL